MSPLPQTANEVVPPEGTFSEDMTPRQNQLYIQTYVKWPPSKTPFKPVESGNVVPVEITGDKVTDVKDIQTVNTTIPQPVAPSGGFSGRMDAKNAKAPVIPNPDNDPLLTNYNWLVANKTNEDAWDYYFKNYYQIKDRLAANNFMIKTFGDTGSKQITGMYAVSGHTKTYTNEELPNPAVRPTRPTGGFGGRRK